MRLFIGIPIPKEFNKPLKELQESLNKKGISTAKHFHLTLHFLGDIEKDQIIEKLKEVKFESFTSNFTELGYFNHGKQISVIWYGLDPIKNYNQLQKKITEKLGIANNKFRPHVTLARVRHFDQEELKKILKSIEHIKIKGTFVVNKFQLINSTLTPKGLEYEILEELSP